MVMVIMKLMMPHGAAWQNACKYSDIKGGVNKCIIFHSVEEEKRKEKRLEKRIKVKRKEIGKEKRSEKRREKRQEKEKRIGKKKE